MTTRTYDPGIDNPATASAARAALERALASDALRGSPQLGAFLRFVVDAKLRGAGDRIKGYTIAIEALGRADTFDPQLDPIVRVEAARLRRALAAYYSADGADDPIEIELPRGRYVPVFHHRVIEGPPPGRARWLRASLRPAGTHLLRIAAALALVVLGAVGYGLIDTLLHSGDPGRPLEASSAALDAASRSSRGPSGPPGQIH